MANYLASNCHQATANQWIDLTQTSRIGTGQARFVAVKYSSGEKSIAFNAFPGGKIQFILMIQSETAIEIGSLAVSFYNRLGIQLVNADIISIGQTMKLKEGKNIVKLTIKQLHLNLGVYTVGFWLSRSLAGDFFEHKAIDYIDSAFEIEVVNLGDNLLHNNYQYHALVPCELEITLVD